MTPLFCDFTFVPSDCLVVFDGSTFFVYHYSFDFSVFGDSILSDSSDVVIPDICYNVSLYFFALFDTYTALRDYFVSN